MGVEDVERCGVGLNKICYPYRCVINMELYEASSKKASSTGWLLSGVITPSE